MKGKFCMKEREQWLKWAIELQSLAQAGLSYSTDVFDEERYKRIREISAEILEYKTGIDLEKIKDLFCNEVGYQTPKMDSRAAVFKDNKIAGSMEYTKLDVNKGAGGKDIFIWEKR